MTVIASDVTNQSRIENSFERITNGCSPEWQTEIQSLPIIVCDDLNALEIYNEPLLFRKAFSDGFGAVKCNINYEGNRYHLIVLNITNIDAIGLDESEFDGVFSHELGHIFNVNPPRDKPSIIRGNTRIQIEEAKNLVLKEMEVYADHFSKHTKTTNGLVGSMRKYLASDNCINGPLFAERIEILNSDAIFQGTIKAVL